MARILLTNFKLIDDRIVDIEIKDNKIIKLEKKIKQENFDLVIDGDCKNYVSSGWIDLHTHCFKKYELYGDEIDEVGYKQGVTTVVDAGSSGADTFDEFKKQIIAAKTNVYAFINIAKQGIATQDELSDLKNLDEDQLLKAIKNNSDKIVGLKARMSKSVLKDNNLEPLEFAKKIAEKTNLPIMIHIGTAPAKLCDVMKIARSNDIVTHIYNNKPNGILDHNGKIHDFVLDAHHRNVKFDLGHGSESFAFSVCQQAYSQGLKCDTISTDIYQKNRLKGPVYSLATTMNKMLYCGYSLEEVINKVTFEPAKILNRPEIGSLEEGNIADLTFFRIENKPCQLVDSQNKIVETNTMIIPYAVLLKDEFINI